MTLSQRYKIGTTPSGIGGYFCTIREYRTARNKRTGRLFTKFIRFINVNDNQRFPDRATALAAGRAKRAELTKEQHDAECHR
jgi:hypothetical protein